MIFYLKQTFSFLSGICRYKNIGKRLLIVMSLLLFINSCQQDSQVYRIGIIYDEAGSDWERKVNSMTLALDEANRQSATRKNKRVRFEYIVSGSGSDAEQAMDVARELVYNKKVNAILGPNTTRAALPVSLVAQNTKTIMISDGSTYSGTTKNKPFVFRVVPTNEQLVTSVLDQIEELGLTKQVAILYDKSNIYSRNAASLITEIGKARGLEIALFNYTQNNSGYEEKLRVISDNFRIVILPNFVRELEEQLTLIGEIDLELSVFILDSWDHRLKGILKPKQSVTVTGLTHPTRLSGTEVAKDFRNSYQQKYFEKPGKGAAASYDAALAIIKAVNNSADFEADSVRKALNELAFNGATGSVEFGAEGNLVKDVSLFKLSKESIESVNAKR